MNFITIGQYFNKLQSVLFILLIVPILAFSLIYYFGSAVPAEPRTEFFIVIVSAVVMDWAMGMIIFAKKIKSVRNEQGLGVKLDKYFKITIVRFSILSSASLMLALGLYLTGSDVFTWLYIAGLLLSGFLWPTGRKVAEDLHLKGDEREMVYFKRDYP